MTEPSPPEARDDAPTPTALVARVIRYHRERLRMTAQQLAERVARLGGNISRQAISKVETGGRGISIDELILLAKALETSPLMLLFPEGTHSGRSRVEYLPGHVLDIWPAARLFTGEAYMAGDVATHWVVPHYLRREHDRLLERYVDELTDQRLFSPPADDPDRKRQRAQGEAALRRIRDVRAEMRRHDLTPPPLPEDLRHIDERRHVFMTPEELDRSAAEHPGDLRFVDYNALRDPDSPYRPVKPGVGERIRQAQEFARNVDPGPTPNDGPDDPEEKA